MYLLQNEAGPYGALPGPFFLFVGNRLHSAYLTFPEFQRADSNSCLSGEGGNEETKEKRSRNKNTLGAGFWFFLKEET